MKYLTFLFAVSCCLAQNATLKGRVTDGESNESLSGALVFILGTSSGATTDKSGRFEIRNLQPGQLIIRTNFFGYKHRIDTIVVSKTNEEIEVILKLYADYANFQQLESQLLSPPELRSVTSYQDSLARFCRQEKVLTIIIDSLYCNIAEEYGGELLAKLSIRNNSDISVFVLKNYSCMMRIQAIILDGLGDTVKTHGFFFDHVGYKCHYDSSDLLVIPPKSTIQYPTTIVWLQSCRGLNDGKYSVRIIYSYQKPKLFSWSTGYPDKNGLLTYLRSIEGNFISENVWHLENRRSKRK